MRYISVSTYGKKNLWTYTNTFMLMNSFIYAQKFRLFLVFDIVFKANMLYFSPKNDNVRAGKAMLEL